MAAPLCFWSERKKSTRRWVRDENAATELKRYRTANVLDDNIGSQANAATKNERNDARHPPRFCPASRHHRALLCMGGIALIRVDEAGDGYR
jgi:hypothetical protein